VEPPKTRPLTAQHWRHSQQSRTIHAGELAPGLPLKQPNILGLGLHAGELPSRDPPRPPAKKTVKPVVKKPAFQSTGLKMPPPPQHLAPHLKTKIKNVLFPYKILDETKWKSMDKHLIKDGVYDLKGRLFPRGGKSQNTIAMEMPNRRTMIEGTMTHFVDAAIRLKVNITADNHGDYKPNREQLESCF
jgi:hypothetical protein